ncbi:MAG: aldo/keto reductase [Chloroflexi bacterium]|uniref:Aldo/keto reductase n=1 Tax=Candidatus Chlorohelix allophototropha TaxID=3003348 RepID=A0A8T7M3I6_9CHLR|nr:aldo/keto reductase [Chloroflexota bacterium]WJW67875.1 aldo/keto reductase [Chloroflexota bacterium L227-S17]
MTNSKFLNDTFSIGGDLKVRRLGFGAMRITGQGIWGEPQDKNEAIAVLRRTIELGINFIDTADSYGPEVSERLIGEALYPYPQDLVIATKGGLMRGGPDNWYPNGRPEHLRATLEGSLKRLRLERIDLYQLHRIDPNVPAEETLGVLADMQQEGKIRHIGLSEVSVEQLEQARKIVKVVSVQNLYNLTNRNWENMVDACEKDGTGFIPWFPLAVGQLAKPGSKLDQIAHKYNATPSQVALAWLLQRSPVMLPIPGTGSVAHLEENVLGAEIELSAEDLAEISKQ